MASKLANKNFDIKEIEATMKKSELLAEEILTDQQQIIDFERRKNSNREALRTLQNEEKKDIHHGMKK